MTQWALPTLDREDGGWTNELDSQTDLFESINEAAAVASADDYIQSPASSQNDRCQFMLDGIHTPRSGSVKLKVKAQWGTAPDNQTLTTTTFFWSADASATSYVLRIGSAPGWADVYNNNVGYVLTYERPLPSGTYYSRVIPYNGSTALTPGDEQTVVVA